MGMYFDVDYGLSTATRTIYYNYNWGEWLTYYWYYFQGWHEQYFDQQYHTAQVYYLGQQWNYNFGDRTSAEGMTQGAFYYTNDPWTVYYHYAQTQVPPGHSIPSEILSYAFLTAHPISYENLDGAGDW